jgi:hypothetical protein
MSTKSKITFAASCLFTTATIYTVFYLKQKDLEIRQIGIHRDDTKRSEQRLLNELEHQQQQELKRKLEKEQSLLNK